MKQVRYLAGAVGIAPLAVATAVVVVPSAAQAAAVGTKTVSLHQVVPAAVCEGGTEALKFGADASEEWFWYTHEASGKTCIGTVEYFESGNGGTGYDMRTRIRGPKGNLQYSHFNTGTISPFGHGITFEDVVRNLFGPGDVQVCTAMVYQSANHSVVRGFGPICETVP
jgi:hypothetical protein